MLPGLKLFSIFVMSPFRMVAPILPHKQSWQQQHQQQGWKSVGSWYAVCLNLHLPGPLSATVISPA